MMMITIVHSYHTEISVWQEYMYEKKQLHHLNKFYLFLKLLYQGGKQALECWWYVVLSKPQNN